MFYTYGDADLTDSGGDMLSSVNAMKGMDPAFSPVQTYFLFKCCTKYVTPSSNKGAVIVSLLHNLPPHMFIIKLITTRLPSFLIAMKASVQLIRFFNDEHSSRTNLFLMF